MFVKWWAEGQISEILFLGGEIGETPLHISARIEEARGEKCTKMLLKSGADTNLAMTDGRTPLHIAAECGSLGKCSIYVHCVANV